MVIFDNKSDIRINFGIKLPVIDYLGILEKNTCNL